jgi:peptidyl-tRNA hydrolase
VLSKLSVDERILISDTALKAAAALEMIIINGVDEAMAKYN